MHRSTSLQAETKGTERTKLTYEAMHVHTHRQIDMMRCAGGLAPKKKKSCLVGEQPHLFVLANVLERRQLATLDPVDAVNRARVDRRLEVVLVAQPLAKDTGAAVLGLHAEGRRGTPDAVLAADAGALVDKHGARLGGVFVFRHVRHERRGPLAEGLACTGTTRGGRVRGISALQPAQIPRCGAVDEMILLFLPCPRDAWERSLVGGLKG